MDVSAILEDIEAKIEDPNSLNFRCLKHSNCLYHDVFISYRVNTEKKIADKLALLLDSCTKPSGFKVKAFLDSHCLLDGGNWEKNFLSALHHAKLIVLIISEAGLDLPSSTEGLTKIQNANKDQDNCLLEYEYALRLKEENKTEILVLCVAKEGIVAGRQCKIKFPADHAGIQRRLAMYADSGEHTHRDGTKGPLIQQTMSKLLGLLTPPESQAAAPNFMHLDPDDPASRVPDILWKLKEVEAKHTKFQMVKMFYDDISYLTIRIIGVLCGTFLPFISLLLILEVRSARQKALQSGIIIGHAIGLLGVTAYFAFKAMTSVPKQCNGFDNCCLDAISLSQSQEYSELLAECDQCTVNTNNCVSDDCADCFCKEFWYSCASKEGSQDGDAFLAIMFAAFSIAVMIYAKFVNYKTNRNKFKARGSGR